MTTTGANPAQTTQANDEDEWEYEYSATETETYYLTLDLPVRQFSKGKDDKVQNTRGGYRVWFNPNFNGPDDEETGHLSRSDERTGGAEDGTESGGPDDEDPLVKARSADTAQQQQQTSNDAPEPGDAAKAAPEELQILDLHSEHPLISYGGSTFRGSWAENIGTEMIFASRDSQNALSALRHLPDDLDLLATSSARVNFNMVELKPKEVPHPTDIELNPRRYQGNGGVYVHIHSDKYGVRRPQADFLEDLTTLKRKRGEHDHVTISTADTPYNQLLHWDSDEEIYRNRVEKNRQRGLRGNHPRGGRRGRRGRGGAHMGAHIPRPQEADDGFGLSNQSESASAIHESRGDGDGDGIASASKSGNG